MIAAFLKAKHWQLFVLTLVIPMVIQFIFMGIMISDIIDESSSSFEKIAPMILCMPLIGLLFVSFFLGWFWSVAVGLQGKIPADITMKLTQFKVFFVVPIVYIFIVLTIGVLFFTSILDIRIFENISIIGVFITIGIILHLFSIFCGFHTMYFTAKTIKTAELQREVRFEDFIGEFFLIWFYPIGIWILQPRINKMVEEEVK